MLWNLTLNVSNNGPQIIILCSTMQILWVPFSWVHNIPTQITADNI